MLRHTLDRIEKIIPAKQLQIVIDHKHRNYLQEEIKEGETKSSPCCSEKSRIGASIYLALSHIYFRDPKPLLQFFLPIISLGRRPVSELCGTCNIVCGETPGLCSIIRNKTN